MFQSTRPQGARLVKLTLKSPDAGFNPRARRGRDSDNGSVNMPEWLFQSTRPQGARRSSRHAHLTSFLFQSTRPQGARRR